MALGYLISESVASAGGQSSPWDINVYFSGQFFFSTLFLPRWMRGLNSLCIVSRREQLQQLDSNLSESFSATPALQVVAVGVFVGYGLWDPGGVSCWALCCCWCGFSAWWHMAWVLLVLWIPYPPLPVFNFFLYFSLSFNIFTVIP